MTRGFFTRFTSAWPAVLGKQFSLDTSGGIVKKTSGNLSRGSYVVDGFDGANDLVRILSSFGRNEALSASVPLDSSTEGHICTESALAANPGAKSRTRQHFTLADAPGLGIIDVDDARLTLEQLYAEACAVAPALAVATVIGWFSGSSLIFNGDACISPAKGLRLYIPVRSAADWPRALRALNARLSLAGHFHCAVSSSGAILDRPLADAAMGDKGARLDFAPAGAICAPPLEQRRGPPQILHDGCTFIDTRVALPNLTAEEDARHRTVAEAARQAVRAEAEAKRSAWSSARENKAIADAAANGSAIDTDAIRAQVRRTQDAALQGRHLLADFELIHVDDDGREHLVTVADLFSDPARWHLAKFLCPLNPEHRDRSPDAIAYLDQPSPVLFDLDTRTSYRLVRQQLSLSVATGFRAQLATQIADHLRNEPDLYLLADQLVMIPPRGALGVAGACA